MSAEDQRRLNRGIASGMAWRFMERAGIQVVSFVLQIILARLLVPEDYGILAIVNVFITFSATLINNGIGNALIQKKGSDALDENTVFFFQLGLSVIIFAAMYGLSPVVAWFYENAMLTQYLRAMSFILIIEALSSIQLTRLRKKMQFRKSFAANLIGNVVHGAVGIAMAYGGCGCWSLIVSQLAMKAAIFLTLLFTVRWKPRRMFSFRRLGQLFSYSWKLSVGWLVGTLHQNVFSLVIGKAFLPEVLGYYNRAQNVPQIVTTTANETVSSVMFPALSRIQDDMQKVKHYTRRMMAFTSLLVMPAMAGLAGVTHSFVYFALTEKWAAIIPMMKLFCISFGINILSTTNMQAFNAIGRSDMFMKMELIKRSLSLVVLLITSAISIEAVIVGLCLMGLVSLLYNVLPNIRLLGYTWKEQAVDILSPLLPSVMMYLAIIQLERLQWPHLATLLAQVVAGVLIYAALALLLKVPAMKTAQKLLRDAVSRMKRKKG